MWPLICRNIKLKGFYLDVDYALFITSSNAVCSQFLKVQLPNTPQPQTTKNTDWTIEFWIYHKYLDTFVYWKITRQLLNDKTGYI